MTLTDQRELRSQTERNKHTGMQSGVSEEKLILYKIYYQKKLLEKIMCFTRKPSMEQAFDFSSARNKANELVNYYTVGAAATAIATGPIPGTSALLTAGEVKMVFDIARIYHFYPTLQEAANTIGALVAASTVLKTIAIEVSTWIPFFGWGVKSAIAGGSCRKIGDLAINYYESKRKGEM